MAAPKQNNNASQGLGKGTQVNFYLSAKDTESIRQYLRKQGIEPSKDVVLRFAREQSRKGIQLVLKKEEAVDVGRTRLGMDR